MHKKRLSRNKMMNCFLPVLSLLIRGRIVGVLWAWPFHFLGMTKHGHLVHFKTTSCKDRWAPLLFEGYMEVLRKPFLCKKYFYIGFMNGQKLYKQIPSTLEKSTWT